MKKIYSLLGSLVLLAMTSSISHQSLHAQTCVNTVTGGTCTLASFFYGEILPNSGCGTFTVEIGYGPGRYFRVPVLQGGCYTVSTCGATTDLRVGAFQPGNTSTPFAYNDNDGPDCIGTAGSLVMVPSFTDYANVDVREGNCLLGGTASITVKLRQNNNLVFTSSASDMCQGQVRALTATPARVVVAPQPGSGDVGTFTGTGVSATNFTGPTPAGTTAAYTLTYNFGYCSTTQIINVFRNPTVANAGAAQTICTASTPISANVPTFGTGAWSVVAGTATVTSPTSASTTVTGIGIGTSVTLRWTINNGPCTASTSDVIITRINPPTTSAAGADQSVCSTSATLAANAPTLGTGAWSVVSGSGTVVTSTSPTSTVNNLSIGPNTFVWAISNGICVASRDTVVITRFAAPTVAQAGSNQAICDSVTSLSGNSPAIGTGTWLVVSGTGNIVAPSNPNSAVNGIGIGTTVLRWVISNGACLASSDTVQITRNALPAPPTVTGNLAVCPGGSAVLTASSAVPGATYTWWNALTGGSALAATALYNSPGLNTSTTFYVDVANVSTGCISPRTPVTVTINAEPVPALGPDTTFCGNDTVCLNPGAFAGYLWSNGSGGATSCYTASGQVWVLVTDTNGCQGLDTIQLSTSAFPVVNLGPDQSLCSNASVSIGVAPGASGTYLWNTGATTPTITVNGQQGIYTLFCTDTAGCTGSDAVTLTLLPDPSAAFTADTSNCPNVVFTNQSTNATTFAWDFADGGTSSTQSPAHNYQSAGNGTYNVRLISTGGCGSDTAIVPVVINCLVGIADPHRVAITLYPNPSNGTFKVRLTGLQEEATLRIYDLGGKQLFRRHLDQRGDFEENVRLDAAAGMYFLKLSVGGQEITKRIVIE